MIAAIHQPNFVPWLGYFYKIAHCDLFIILDDVQFTKNSFINRNRIKTPQGQLWLTLPVEQSGRFGQTISETLVKSKEQIAPKLLRTIQMNYSKAPHFRAWGPQFEEILMKKEHNLADINLEVIRWVCGILGINTPFKRSSELGGIAGESTERLVNICKKVGADTYLSGLGGNNYQEVEMYAQAGLRLVTSPFAHPVYAQPWGEFLPNLSVLDALFNCGGATKDFLNGRR
jgi:hypothetical protein